jgi:hypothetical protein
MSRKEKEVEDTFNRGSKKKVRKRRKKKTSNRQDLTESLKKLQQHFHENYSNGR